MRKLNFSLLFGFILAVSSPLQGVGNQKDDKAAVKPENSTQSPKAAVKPGSTIQGSKAAVEEEEYELMDRDQVDNSNTLAIPFDDSEVEDEEEVDRIEGKDLFKLPHSR